VAGLFAFNTSEPAELVAKAFALRDICNCWHVPTSWRL